MSPFLDFNLEDVPDVTLAPDNTEHQLTCRSCEYNEEKHYLRLIFEFADDPTVEDIFHYASLPKETDEPKTELFKKRNLKALCEALQVPLSFEDPAEFVGRSMWAVIGIRDNETYGRANEIKKISGPV